MSTITTRSGKGSPLTHNEVDANFTNLNTDKYQSGDNVTFGTATVTTFTSTGIDDNATSTAITINSSQNVGIGTASPASLLSVTGGTGEHLVDIQGAGSSFDLQLNSGNAGTVSSSMYSLALYYGATKNSAIDFYRGTGGTDGFLTLSTSNTERFRIDSSGNVGIGTASPSYLVDARTASGNAQIHLRSGGDLAQLLLISNDTTGTSQINFGDADANNIGIISYSHNQNALKFTSNSAERMRIDSSGRVGIGTTSPSSPLTVNGTITIGTGTGTYQAGSLGYSDSNWGFIYRPPQAGAIGAHNFEAFNGDDIMVLTEGGNVGIGTASPATTMHLRASSSNIRLEDADTNAYGQIGVDNAGSLYLQADNGNGQASSNMYMYIDGTERMRIDSSGRVNIGQASFGTATYLGVGAANQAGFEVQPEKTTNHCQILGYDRVGAAYTSFTFDALDHKFNVSASEAMRIDSSGNVGIGTTSPFATARLQVNTGTNLNLAIQTGTTETSGMKINAFNDAATANIPLELNGSVTLLKTGETERMRIDSSGYVLIGTTSTTVNTSNFGTAFAGTGAPGYMASYRNVPSTGVAVLFGGNAGQVYIRGDGDLENTNNSYGAISDERLKSNIVDASSQINDIMAVQVRSYTLNETGATHIGVVAQELEASGMSGLVKTDDEGMKAVKYSVLYMKAIKALQEAVTRIETLEAEVAALKGA